VAAGGVERTDSEQSPNAVRAGHLAQRDPCRPLGLRRRRRFVTALR
jgi:hypothetical protein